LRAEQSEICARGMERAKRARQQMNRSSGVSGASERIKWKPKSVKANSHARN